MFKFPSFLTKIFKGKKKPEKVKVVDKAPERKDLKPLVRKIKKRQGSRITRTALNCVMCGIPLLEYPRNPGRIVFTCSDICRRISRGGKRNRRILARLFITRRESWSKKQEALAKLKTRFPVSQPQVKSAL